MRIGSAQAASVDPVAPPGSCTFKVEREDRAEGGVDLSLFVKNPRKPSLPRKTLSQVSWVIRSACCGSLVWLWLWGGFRQSYYFIIGVTLIF